MLQSHSNLKYSVPLFLASGEFLNDSLFLITLSYVVLLSPLPSLVPSPLLTGLTPPSDLTPNSCTRLFISLVSSGLDYTSGVSHPSSVQGIFLKRNFGACIQNQKIYPLCLIRGLGLELPSTQSEKRKYQLQRLLYLYIQNKPVVIQHKHNFSWHRKLSHGSR